MVTVDRKFYTMAMVCLTITVPYGYLRSALKSIHKEGNLHISFFVLHSSNKEDHVSQAW